MGGTKFDTTCYKVTNFAGGITTLCDKVEGVIPTAEKDVVQI